MAPSLPKTNLLWFLGELWIGRRATIKFLLPLVPLFVHHAGRGVHFGAGLLGAAQVLEQLSAEIMNAGVSGIEFCRGVDFNQGLRVFPLALIDLGQLISRTGQRGIETQCLAQIRSASALFPCSTSMSPIWS